MLNACKDQILPVKSEDKIRKVRSELLCLRRPFWRRFLRQCLKLHQCNNLTSYQMDYVLQIVENRSNMTHFSEIIILNHVFMSSYYFFTIRVVSSIGRRFRTTKKRPRENLLTFVEFIEADFTLL